MGNKQVEISGPTKLCKQHTDILKNATKFSEEEIREWHAEFLRDCHNGKLGKKEFKKFHRQYCRPEKANIFCDYIFKTYARNGNSGINYLKVTDKKEDCALCNDQGDRPGNESLNFAEFLIAVSPGSQGKLEDRISVLFDMYDKNGDKSIDERELTSMITAMYDLVDATELKGNNDPKNVAKKIMKDCYKDGGKKLSKEEIIYECKHHPYIRHLLAPYDEEGVHKW
ncbi:unnamed protein product [Rotaria magnacalcarata]|uniref:EF-hand domain-containing protein n=2 Tax=Rotaria magnacalcarata TaxID=392030 RepID=A0A8S2M443_9BILA|nr:unnamed protein product [Rotaria magnacalcarata]